MERILRHPRTLAALQYTGYTAFFIVALVLCIPWTFPSRQLRTFVARQARLAGYPLKLDSISLSGLGSVQVNGLRVTLPGKPGEMQEGGAMGPALPEVELKIDHISAKIALLPLIFGRNVDLRFDLQAGDGSLQDGHVVKKGDTYDIDIGKIDSLSLGALGIGQRALGPQTFVMGDLDGKLGGKAQVHYGGSTDDLTGAIELELADAILKSPEVSMMGGFKLTDLGVGTLTIKVKMNLKQNVAALAAQRGAEKATVLHIETLKAEGDDLILHSDETSHILIPPGKGGLKQATINLRFSFQFQDGAAKKEAALAAKDAAGKDAAAKDGAGKDGAGSEAAGGAKAAKPQDDRAKWTKVLAMAGSRLKPFERNGFIGIACTGSLFRPQCKPELPTVLTGLKGGAARLEGPTAVPAGKDGPPPTADAPPVEGAEPAAAPAAPVEFKPAMRPEAPPVPEPPPAALATPPPAPEAPAAAAEPGRGPEPAAPVEERGGRPPPAADKGREPAEGRGEAGGDNEGEKAESDREEVPKAERVKRNTDEGAEE